MKVAIKNVMMLGVVAVGPAAFLQGCGDDDKNSGPNAAQDAKPRAASAPLPSVDGAGLKQPGSRSVSRKQRAKSDPGAPSLREQSEVEQEIHQFVEANDKFNFSKQGIRGDLKARATETGKTDLSVTDVKQFLDEKLAAETMMAEYVEGLDEEQAAQFADFTESPNVSKVEKVRQLIEAFEELQRAKNVNPPTTDRPVVTGETDELAKVNKQQPRKEAQASAQDNFITVDQMRTMVRAYAADKGASELKPISAQELEKQFLAQVEDEAGKFTAEDVQQFLEDLDDAAMNVEEGDVVSAAIEKYATENGMSVEDAQELFSEDAVKEYAEKNQKDLTDEEQVMEVLEMIASANSETESRKDGDSPGDIASEQQKKKAAAVVESFKKLKVDYAAALEPSKGVEELVEDELKAFYMSLTSEQTEPLRRAADSGNEQAIEYVAEMDGATEVEMSEAKVRKQLESLAAENGKDVNSLTPEEAGQMLPKPNGAGNDVQPVGTVSPSRSSGNLDAEERREGTDDASEQLSKERRQAERDAGVAKQPKTDAAVDVEAIIAEYAAKNSLNDDDVQVLRDELDALAAEQGAPLSAADVQAFLAEQANYEVDDQAETSAAAVVVDGTAKTDTAMNIGMVNGVRTWTFGAKDAKKVVLFFLGWTTTIESWSSDIPWNFQSTLTEAHPDTAFMVHQAPDGPNGKPSWFPFPNLAKLELDCAGVVDQVPVVDGILDHVRTEYKVTNREIHLMGFSQGGALAMYSAVLLGVKAVSSILGWWPRPLEQNFEMSDTPPDVLNFVTSTTDKVIRPWMAEMSIGKIRAQFGNHFHEQKVKQEHRAAAFTQETKEAIVNCLANWSEPKPALVPGAKQQMNPMDLFGALLGGDVNDSPGHGARGGDLGNLLGGLIMQTGRNHEEMAPERPLGHFEQALGGNGIMV